MFIVTAQNAAGVGVLCLYQSVWNLPINKSHYLAPTTTFKPKQITFTKHV